MALPAGPRPQPYSPSAADATLRAMLGLNRAVTDVTRQFDRVTDLFRRLPGLGGIGGIGGGGGPSVPRVPVLPPLPRVPLPVVMPRVIALPAPPRLPVGNVIHPVRLVRFEGQAYGQLASLMSRARGVAPPNPVRDRLGGLPPNPLRPLTLAAAGATASIVGLARSGLSGTVEGYRLANEFTILSRTVASTFLPVIDLITAKMQKLNFALMSMDGDQQRGLMKAGLGVAGVGLAGGGLTALAPVLGPVLGMFTGLVPTFASLAAAGGPVTIVLGLVAAGAAVVAAGLGYLVVVCKPVRDAVWKVIESLQKAWEATKPLREAIFDLVSTAAIAFFEELAREINAVASDPAIIQFLKDMGAAIADAANAIPGFIAEIGQMRDQLANAVARDGLDIAGERVKKIKLDMAIAENQRQLGNKALQGFMWNPFRDKDLANAKGIKDDRPDQRRVTPFQPGRSDAVSYLNQLQDNFLKVGINEVPKQQLAELVAIKLGQGAMVVAVQELAQRLGFNMRPVLDGRPGGR